MELIQSDFLKLVDKFPENDEIKQMKDLLDYSKCIPFSPSEIDRMQKIINISNNKICTKSLFGKYIIPQDSSKDMRNNLYRMIKQISCLPMFRGVSNAFSNKDARLSEVSESIEHLPAQTSSDEDIMKYLKIENYITFLATVSLEENPYVKFNINSNPLKTFREFLEFIKIVNNNSIIDCEKGKSLELIRLESAYSKELANSIKTLKENPPVNPICMNDYLKEIEELNDLRLDDEKFFK